MNEPYRRPHRHGRRRRRGAGARIALFCVLAACLVGASVFALVKSAGPSAAQVSGQSAASQPAAASPAASVTQAPQPTVSTVRFSASGDDLIHDGLYLMARDRAGGNGYDFSHLYEQVAPFYQNFDVNWVNQETLVTDELPPSGYPCFCSPGNVAHSLYDIGFRVFSLSNNHSYDQGAVGISDTLRFWESMPADTVSVGLYRGAADYTNIRTQEVNGIRIAYLSYAEHTNGIPTPEGAEASVILTSQTDVIQQQIQLARSEADVVVACVHWGTENSHEVNDAQRTLGQQMADWGADVIIGTHPHVVQPVEFLTAAGTGKRVPIFYSLGNFVSLQQQEDNLVGIIGTFVITKTTQPDGTSTVTVDSVHAVPIVMYYNSSFTEGQVYLLQNYTDALAAQQANRAVTPAFAAQLVQTYVSSDVLQLAA